MVGNTLRKKQEIIKQQEKQIKQYEELLMAISKENREIREREDLLFHDSPDFIEMTERIKWFSSLNSFNEKALAVERSRRLIFDEETRQVYIDNKRLIEEKTNEEYFVGITEYQHGAEDWMHMKKNILKLQGKIAQLKEVLENRENKIKELQKELSICQKNSGQVHNARGAGRKKMNREMRDRLALFDKLLGEGHPMSEIMGKMGISKATYFRYLKISRQGEENLGGMGSP
jgi:hypothetical protein